MSEELFRSVYSKETDEETAVDTGGLEEHYSISIPAFYEMTQQENNLFLLDVRNQEDFNASRIETAHTPETHHLPYISFIVDAAKACQQLPTGRDIVVVCSMGGSSDYVVDILQKKGIHALNLEGGMAAWKSYLEERTS